MNILWIFGGRFNAALLFGAGFVGSLLVMIESVARFPWAHK